MISLIAAMGNNRVIGLNNDMPWHLPKDLAHFKKITTGHTIVMGRKTYESIGRPLPNRKNIILTRQASLRFPEEVMTVSSLETVLKWNEENPEEEIFIIGGGNLYKQALPYADRLYLTEINEDFDGDTFFPAFDKLEWDVVDETIGERDINNPYDFKFITYERRNS